MLKSCPRLSVRSVRLVGVFLVCSVVMFGAIDLFSPVDLVPEHQARLVVDSQGVPLRAFADNNGVWRYQTSPQQVSPAYLESLIQYEDRWFYQHPGVNPLSLVRAGWQWLTSGEIVSGGSTLTMQVVRIRYRLKSGLRQKLVQIVRALQLELHFSKSEILNYYLNHAPFGGVLEGVEAASRSYFGYSAAHLTQAQAALLAVLPQAPSRYRPDRYPLRAQHQRDKVLDRLVDFGRLAQEEAQDAKLEQVVADLPRLRMRAPLLARRLVQEQPNKSVIVSFIEKNIQAALESIAANSAHLIPERASLAIMVMEHGSGKVVGYVGSQNLLDAQRFGHVDMVRAQRSPGSTLKPFIYGLALDQGILHSESLLMDVPLSFGDYRPQNFNRGFSGPVSVSAALQKSLNIPAVQVLEQLGSDNFYAQLQTVGAGLTLPPNAKPNLAMALGGLATNLEHLVRLYSVLGNGGESIRPRFSAADPEKRARLLSPGAAWIIRNLLYRSGDGNDSQTLAIKTGTSYAYRDAWALAVAEHHTIGIWVGRPDNAAMQGHYGNLTAVPIAQAVAAILPTTENSVHSRPDSVSRKSICWPGGQQSATLCDEKRNAWILDDTVPKTLMSTLEQRPLIPTAQLRLSVATDTGLRASLGCSVEKRRLFNVAVWPAPLQNWIARDWRNRTRIPDLDPRCDVNDGLLPETPVQIVGLSDQSKIKLHASTLKSPSLLLEAVGGQPQWHWFLNGKLLEHSGSRLNLPIPPVGDYQLVVTDQAGMSDSLRFRVEP